MDAKVRRAVRALKDELDLKDSEVVPLPVLFHNRGAKIGRSTGWTRGEVVAEDFGPLEIWFPALNRNVTISNLTEIAWAGLDHPFSSEGDSGSLTTAPVVAGDRRHIGARLIVCEAAGLQAVSGSVARRDQA